MAYGKGIKEEIYSMEGMNVLNAKDPNVAGGYVIPDEKVIQKYLKERINPLIPTSEIIAALDQRKWERKQQAEAQGPQQSVLEDIITETDTAMKPSINPMMAQGIQQGQPKPMPGQMPRQMAGLGRPPMPRRVPPQQRMGTGIPTMAAAGGYVANMADGGIVGFAPGDLVRSKGFSENYSVSPYTTDFGKPLVRQPYVNPREELFKKNRAISALEDKIQTVNSEPDSLEKIGSIKELTRQLEAIKATPIKGGGYEEGDETLYSPIVDKKIDTFEEIEEPGKVVTEVIKNKQEEVEKDLKNNNPEAVKKVKEQIAGDTGFTGMVGEAEDAADLLNENAFDMTYGKDKVDQMSIEDFRERLTGEGSAFAKQQQTTQEFRDELNKRAEESIMTTDEVLLKLGLGLMASGATKGRELEALGKVGLNVNKEFDQREDKSFNIKDKAKMLDLNLNKAEIELEMAEERFGQNSKQFEEKTRQFNKALAQKETLFREGEVGKTDRAEIAADAAVKAARIKSIQDEDKFVRKQVLETRNNIRTKNLQVDRAVKNVLSNSYDKTKKGSETYTNDANGYLNAMIRAYESSPDTTLQWTEDVELVNLYKKLNEEKIITGKDGNKYIKLPNGKYTPI